MKICLICSPGGHLIESLGILEAFKPNELLLMTYEEDFEFSTSSDIKTVYTLKNFVVKRVKYPKVIRYFFLFINMIYLAIKEFYILLKENPDIIVSTGSEIAIPSFYLGKILRKKTIFIESLTRINELSGTGKLVYPVSDLFLVQWKNLTKKYKKSIYSGNIFNSIRKGSNKNKGNYIFVTVGTASFKRLVSKMDEISKNIDEKIIIQIGRTDYIPKNAEYFEFTKDLQEFNELNKNAKVVISHAGIGNVVNALENSKPLIIVPRRSEFNEIFDNHQLKMAEVLEDFHLVNVAHNENEILGILKKIDFNLTNENDHLDSKTNEPNLISYIKNIINTWGNEKHEN